MHIQKYFSQNKILSRREVDRYLKEGRIKVNGSIVKGFGKEIDPQKDKIEIVGGLTPKTTLVFHKPRGISSSKVPTEGKNILDLLPQYQHLNTIGRLDKESEGLLLLTNDGVLAHIITSSDHIIEKEYLVEVREDVTQSKMKALSQGMILEDGPTLPCKAQKLSTQSFSIILKEGRNHQIRRMANKVRLTITKLKRVRVGTIHLGNLKAGQFREATPEEIEHIKKYDI